MAITNFVELPISNTLLAKPVMLTIIYWQETFLTMQEPQLLIDLLAKKIKAVNIWKSYACTAVEKTNKESIFAVMKTTELVVEIRPEKVQACRRSWVQIPYGPDFFQALF